MATVVAEKVIRIDVIASATAQKNIELLANQVQKVEQHTAKMKDSLESGFGSIGNIFGKLTGVLAGLGVTVGLGAIAKAALDAASAYTVLESRLKLVTGSQERANVGTKDVIEIAKATGREIDGISKLYEKATRATQQYGLSQEDARKITLGFSQSLRLSGTSTQEAYAAVVQFGQALASGRLQGDEFRSLLENNSVFMYEFAKAAGVTVTELRKMGTEGKLNTEKLFKTMLTIGADGLNLVERLNKQAEAIPFTFAQSASSLATQATALAGELAKVFTGDGTPDKLGFFGGFIRQLEGLTKAIADARKEADAAGTGVLGKILSSLGAAKDFSDAAFSGKALGPEDTLDRRLKGLDDSRKKVQDALNRDDADLQIAEERAKKFLETTGKIPAGLATQVEVLKANVDKSIISLRKLADLENEILIDGEDSKSRTRPGREKLKTGPTEATAEQKAAFKAFNDYVLKIEEAVIAQDRLDQGLSETSKAAREQAVFLDIAAKAGISENNALVKLTAARILDVESRREIFDEQKKFEASKSKEIELLNTSIAKIDEQGNRDLAAIDAIKNKTKASQEYTQQKLAELVAEDQARIATLTAFGAGSQDPVIVAYQARIDKAKETIAVSKELTAVQRDERQTKVLEKLDKADQADVEKTAAGIKRSLINGLSTAKDGDIGTKLWENIQQTFKDRVIDLVFNPILEPISQALAQIATDFGKVLSQKLAESIANNQAGDSLDNFLKFMNNYNTGGGSSVNPTGAVGIERVPYDGFVATLHRDERVQTANEANDMRNGRMGSGSWTFIPTYQFNIDSRSDEASIRVSTQKAVQQGNIQLLEELRSRGVIA